MTLGGHEFNENQINFTSYFNESAPLISYKDDVYFQGVYVEEYRWVIMGADPSNIKPKTKSAYAIFEFDLPYISIPRYVFKSVKSKFEN